MCNFYARLMEGTIFTAALEKIKHVKSEEGEILTMPFLDLCKTILPVLGKVVLFLWFLVGHFFDIFPFYYNLEHTRCKINLYSIYVPGWLFGYMSHGLDCIHLISSFHSGFLLMVSGKW